MLRSKWFQIAIYCYIWSVPVIHYGLRALGVELLYDRDIAFWVLALYSAPHALFWEVLPVGPADVPDWIFAATPTVVFTILVFWIFRGLMKKQDAD